MRLPAPRSAGSLLAAVLIAAPLLSGCAAGPDYAGPPKVVPDAVTGGPFARAGASGFSAGPGLARWWEGLGDPALTGLVEEALAHSPDIALAQARIREAQAQLGQQDAAGLPSANLNTTYLHATLPGTDNGGTTTLNFYNLGGMASWEPDLFDGARRGREQAGATVERRFADLADAQVSLSAQVATAYVNLRMTQQRIALDAQGIALQRRALALTQQRFGAGTASALDVERLRTALERNDAQATAQNARRDQYLDQLAILTGQAPGTLDARLAAPAEVPLPPAAVAIGDPAALLARRPDIRSADRALAASTAGIGVQQARLYPSIRFLGILGLGGTRPGDMLDPSNLTTLLAPMLQWNILDFGRQKSAVREAEAQRDEAEAQYRKTVLAALEDAETSLSAFGNARVQLGQFIAASDAAARASTLNGQRVAAGTSSLIDQLDIERQDVTARTSVLDARTQLALSYIRVQKSLGLGWEPQQP